VIVGGGMAGGNAAVTLREEGYRGRITIISAEPGAPFGRPPQSKNAEPGVPFGRPPLSKTYLRSEENLDGWLVRPAGWYDEHDVDRLSESGAAVIDAAAHTVRLGSGQELGPAGSRFRGLTCRASTTCARWLTARRSREKLSLAGAR
jgi:3-phenylpropionate/trans-cinnamate dioxygenase ferredoxin reductase subunit